MYTVKFRISLWIFGIHNEQVEEILNIKKYICIQARSPNDHSSIPNILPAVSERGRRSERRPGIRAIHQSHRRGTQANWWQDPDRRCRRHLRRGWRLREDQGRRLPGADLHVVRLPRAAHRRQDQEGAGWAAREGWVQIRRRGCWQGGQTRRVENCVAFYSKICKNKCLGIALIHDFYCCVGNYKGVCVSNEAFGWHKFFLEIEQNCWSILSLWLVLKCIIYQFSILNEMHHDVIFEIIQNFIKDSLNL